MGILNRDLAIPPTWPPPREPHGARALVAYARQRDPIGHRVHIGLAMAHLATLPIITSVKDITFGLLIFYTILRLPNIWRCYTPLVRDRLLWVMLAWAVVFGLSIAWSVDRMEGLVQFKSFRIVLLPLALWPVLDASVLLIGAFLAGVFGLNIVQVAQRLELFGQSTAAADRATGTLHAIQTGALSVAALTWCVVGLLRVRLQPSRHALAALAIATCAAGAAYGLLASGSRGGWIAAAVVLPALLIWFALRDREVRRRAIIIMIGMIAVAAGTWLAAGDFIRARINQAVKQYNAAVEEGDYLSSAGLRIITAEWSWRFFTASPVYGHGAGSFRALSRQTTEFEEMAVRWPARARSDRFTPAHPHNAYLHMMVVAGVFGLAVLVAFLAVAVVRAVRLRTNDLFGGAPLFVLIGWGIGTVFDCFHLNGHLFGLLGLVVALLLRWNVRDDGPGEHVPPGTALTGAPSPPGDAL